MKARCLKINPFILLVFCLFMYPPKLISASFLMPVVIYTVSIAYILLNWKLLRDACRRQSKIIILAFAVFLASLAVPLICGTGDFSYVDLVTGYFLEKGVVYLFLLCLLLKKYREEKLLYYFMYYFIVTHFVYILGTLLFVLFPSSQDFWFNIFDKKAADVYLKTDAYIFRIGWQGFAGYTLTLHCTISIIFLFFLRYGCKKRLITTRQFVILFVSCLVGNMFYGRTGLILTILITILSAFIWNRKRLKTIAIFAGIAIVCIPVLIFLKNSSDFSNWFNWMSKPIANLITTGEFNDSSFDTLKEMTQVDMSADTFLFGDGLYSEDGKYYMHTDAGFVRNILYWGMSGAVLSYGLTLYSIFKIGKINKLMMLELLITFLAFEYKGSIYHDFVAIDFILIMAFCISVNTDFQLSKNGDNHNILIDEKKEDDETQ